MNYIFIECSYGFEEGFTWIFIQMFLVVHLLLNGLKFIQQVSTIRNHLFDFYWIELREHLLKYNGFQILHSPYVFSMFQLGYPILLRILCPRSLRTSDKGFIVAIFLRKWEENFFDKTIFKAVLHILLYSVARVLIELKFYKQQAFQGLFLLFHDPG